MSLHLNTFVKFILTPPVPVLPSFKEASSPDYTFTVAGLQISGHNNGLPVGGWAYLTVSRDRAPVSAVPEPVVSLLLFIGICVIAAYKAGRK